MPVMTTRFEGSRWEATPACVTTLTACNGNAYLYVGICRDVRRGTTLSFATSNNQNAKEVAGMNQAGCHHLSM